MSDTKFPLCRAAGLHRIGIETVETDENGDGYDLTTWYVDARDVERYLEKTTQQNTVHTESPATHMSQLKRDSATHRYAEEDLLARYKKALDLALYYVEGDATYEGVKLQIDKILAGINPEDDGNMAEKGINIAGKGMDKTYDCMGKEDGGLVFRAEDFIWPDEVNEHAIVQQANRIFRRWLSAQPLVYGDANRDKGNGDNCVGWTQTPCAALDTHTARLCAITPLQADSAEAIVRELAECAKSTIKTPTMTYEMLELIERARKLTHKEDL